MAGCRISKAGKRARASQPPHDKASGGAGWLEAVACLAELATLSITPRNCALKSGYCEFISEGRTHFEVNADQQNLRLASEFLSSEPLTPLKLGDDIGI